MSIFFFRDESIEGGADRCTGAVELRFLQAALGGFQGGFGAFQLNIAHGEPFTGLGRLDVVFDETPFDLGGGVIPFLHREILTGQGHIGFLRPHGQVVVAGIDFRDDLAFFEKPTRNQLLVDLCDFSGNLRKNRHASRRNDTAHGADNHLAFRRYGRNGCHGNIERSRVLFGRRFFRRDHIGEQGYSNKENTDE